MPRRGGPAPPGRRGAGPARGPPLTGSPEAVIAFAMRRRRFHRHGHSGLRAGSALAALLAGCAPALRPSEPGPRIVMESLSPAVAAASERCITPATLIGPLRFLSDDLLEGRGPGTRGDDLARAYIRSTMELIGLEPAAPGNRWEQPFDLVGMTTIPPAQWNFAAPGATSTLEPLVDFVANPGTAAPEVEVGPAEVVFAGYGIDAPEFEWDDFKDVDVAGKILLLLNDDPDWDPALFAGRRRLYYGRWTYKYENAARHGALGAIIVHTDASAGYPWSTVVSSWSGETSRLADGGDAEVRLKAWVTADAAARIARLGGHDLDALVARARSRDFRPVPLGVSTSLRLESHIREYRTANVLGLLRGSDRRLASEVVVLTAHHDHLGMRTLPDGGKEIYNGALDNASGVSTLLAIAHAFTNLPDPPRRSILFIATAAEEQGLLGSAYYVAHPVVPIGQTAANINFDGSNVWGRARDVRAIGFGRSTLDEPAGDAATRQRRTYEEEEFPGKGFFYRSDQYSFAKVGVPAISLRGGSTLIGKPLRAGRQRVESWVSEHYHQPTDDWDPSWDLAGMVEDAWLAFDVAVSVANDPAMPRWKPGDEFEAARLRSLSWLPR